MPPFLAIPYTQNICLSLSLSIVSLCSVSLSPFLFTVSLLSALSFMLQVELGGCLAQRGVCAQTEGVHTTHTHTSDSKPSSLLTMNSQYFIIIGTKNQRYSVLVEVELFIETQGSSKKKPPRSNFMDMLQATQSKIHAGRIAAWDLEFVLFCGMEMFRHLDPTLLKILEFVTASSRTEKQLFVCIGS